MNADDQSKACCKIVKEIFQGYIEHNYTYCTIGVSLFHMLPYLIMRVHQYPIFADTTDTSTLTTDVVTEALN